MLPYRGAAGTCGDVTHAQFPAIVGLASSLLRARQRSADNCSTHSLAHTLLQVCKYADVITFAPRLCRGATKTYAARRRYWNCRGGGRLRSANGRARTSAAGADIMASRAAFEAKLALCRRVLSAGLSLHLRVYGTSMLPALWPGEFISVQSAGSDTLKVGDVVVFARAQRMIVHRIVGRPFDSDLATCTTRGDAQLHDDAPVRASELLGIVTSVHRFGSDRPMFRRLPVPAQAIAWFVRRSDIARRCVARSRGLLASKTIRTQAIRIGS